MEKAYAMYLRKSRKDAARESVEETLARHEQRLLKLAQQQGLVIGTVYREVVSGDSIAARPEMQRLLQAVQRGQYQGVLVVELERLARGDTKDQGVVAEAFQCSGTRIVTPAKTYDPDNEFDEEYFEFGLFMSRREYKTIKRRMQAGVRQSVGAGNYLPPCAPFGYDILRRGRRDRTLVPNGDAPVVRLIFQWYAAGCSCPEIARRLTALGCRTATGCAQWPPTSVAKILHNDVYLGRVHYGTYRQRKEFDEATCQFRPRARKAPPEEILTAPGKHPALISEDLWQQAAARHRAAPVPGGQTLRDPLAGLLRCAVCGAALQYKTARRAAHVDRWFSHRSPNACRCAGVKASALLGALAAAIEAQCPALLFPAPPPEAGQRQLARQLAARQQALRAQQAEVFTRFEQHIYTPAEFAQRREAVTAALETIGQTLAELEPTPTVPLPRAQLRTVLQDPTSNAGALRQFFTAILAQVRYARPSRDAPFTLELEFLA